MPTTRHPPTRKMRPHVGAALLHGDAIKEPRPVGRRRRAGAGVDGAAGATTWRSQASPSTAVLVLVVVVAM